MQKGIGKRILELYARIKKFTLISAVIRISAIVLSLLEKSAVLLLMVTILLLILPAVIFAATVYAFISVTKYVFLHKEVSTWLNSSDKITVFITKRRVLSNKNTDMFVRQAEEEAHEYDHPVILVCKDPIIAAKWYALNLLAIKTDYFFVLKRRYLEKNNKKTTYIVL